MTPKASFWNRFSARGRLINRWARALGESDPGARVAALRAVAADLLRDPFRYADLVLPFLGAYLGAGVADLLAPEDLSAVADAAGALAAGPVSQVSAADVYFRLADCYEVRGDPGAALATFRRVFTGTHPTEAKDEALFEMARLGGDEAADLRGYLALLRRAPSAAEYPRLVELVTGALTVGFDSPREAIERAVALAPDAINVEVVRHTATRAKGVHALVVTRDYAKARSRFTRLIQDKRADRLTVTGYAASCLELADTAAVRQVLNGVRARAEGHFRNFAALVAALDWLDNVTDPADAPLTTQQLDELGLTHLAPDTVSYVRGRLLLLSGDARGAAAALGPLTGRRTDQPQWAYHAAWADLLLGDAAGVARCLRGAGDWEGSWATACLAVDTGTPPPAEALAAHLERAPKSLQSLLAWRVAVALGRPAPAVTQVEMPPTPEEQLETLRTVLGYQLHTGNWAGADRSLAAPVFRRQPAADREFWHGVRALLGGNVREGCRRLELAAVLYSYPRAALALVAHQLRAREFDAAPPFLRRLAGRTDPRVALARAYHQAQEASSAEAARSGETATDPRARHLLGHVALRRCQTHRRAGREDAGAAAAAEAAGHFRAVAASHVPEAEAARVLLAVAQFLNNPGKNPQVPDTNGLHPWVRWVGAVARLAHGSADQAAEAVSELTALAPKDRPIEPRVMAALAERLAATAAREPKPAGAVRVAGAIRRLPGADVPAVRRWADLCDALALQRGAPAGAPTTRGTGAWPWPSPGPSSATASGRTPRSFSPPPVRTSRRWSRCALPSPLCRGEEAPTDALVARYAGGPKPIAQAAHLAVAAAAFASNNPARGYEHVGRAAPSPDDKATGVLDIPRCVVGLVASTAARGPVPDELRARAKEHLNRSAGGLTEARLAAILGDTDLAGRLWRAAEARDGGAIARQEHTKYLRHRAVVARAVGDDNTAADLLRRAAAVVTGEPA